MHLFEWELFGEMEDAIASLSSSIIAIVSSGQSHCVGPSIISIKKIGIMTFSSPDRMTEVMTMMMSADNHYLVSHPITYFIFSSHPMTGIIDSNVINIVTMTNTSYSVVGVLHHHLEDILASHQLDYVIVMEDDVIFVEEMSEKFLGKRIVMMITSGYATSQFGGETNEFIGIIG